MLRRKPASSESQTKHSADLPLHRVSEKESPLSCLLQKTFQTECSSLLLPVHHSICPPGSLLLSVFFPSIILYSLPVNWLLALLLDQWLTLFNPIYTIQIKSSWIKGMC